MNISNDLDGFVVTPPVTLQSHASQPRCSDVSETLARVVIAAASLDVQEAPCASIYAHFVQSSVGNVHRMLVRSMWEPVTACNDTCKRTSRRHKPTSVRRVPNRTQREALSTRPHAPHNRRLRSLLRETPRPLASIGFRQKKIDERICAFRRSNSVTDQMQVAC